MPTQANSLSPTGKMSNAMVFAVAALEVAEKVVSQHHVASLLDLVKAFERIPHHLVAAAAARLEFDLVV